MLKISQGDRCCLILEKDGELTIEEDFSNDQSRIKHFEKIFLEKSNAIAKSIVRYVARTIETVSINSKENLGIFASDAYITEQKIKSIACIPILLKGVPAGVLYLENSFQENAFTGEILETLRLLTSQLINAKKAQEYLEMPIGEKSIEGLLPGETLTARESDVLQLIASGMSNKEIAEKLGIKANTVKGYIKNVYGKLGANRRVQVAAKARKLGL